MAPSSKLDRDLANIRLQLRSGKKRGVNGRDLNPPEIQELEAQRDELVAQQLENKRRRVVARVNAHTTQEAEETRQAVREEGEHTRKAMQPIVDLITVKDTNNKREAIVAR